MGLDGAVGSMVPPESALISLRRIVSPAPEVGLNRSLSAWVWVAEAAFSMVLACPKPSDAPNPVMVWNVDAPLMVAVSAAAAGPDGPRAVRAVTPSKVAEAISDTLAVCFVSLRTVPFLSGLAKLRIPGETSRTGSSPSSFLLVSHTCRGASRVLPEWSIVIDNDL